MATIYPKTKLLQISATASGNATELGGGKYLGEAVYPETRYGTLGDLDVGTTFYVEITNNTNRGLSEANVHNGGASNPVALHLNMVLTNTESMLTGVTSCFLCTVYKVEGGTAYAGALYLGNK